MTTGRRNPGRRYTTSTEKAAERGKRDAQAKRAMATPYAAPEKQEAYERGYLEVRLQGAGRVSR